MENLMNPLKKCENKFGKVAEYTIDAQKSIVFLYTSHEQSEKEIKANSLRVASKE